MERYEEIDIMKGIAILCMILFHIFYFPNQYGFTEIKYDTLPLLTTAKIAQFIFLISVGINLVFSYYSSKKKKEDQKKFIQKNIYRVFKLVFFALFMTLFTYFIFGEKYVKFGILHFIALSSLVLFPFVNNMKIIYSILILLTIIYFLLRSNPSIFSNVPPKLAFISGFYSNYQSIDHFPIVPWMILICIGIILGHFIYKEKPKFPEKIKDKYFTKILETSGKYSLEIYIIHWLIIYIIFCHIYPNYIRNVPVFDTSLQTTI